MKRRRLSRNAYVIAACAIVANLALVIAFVAVSSTEKRDAAHVSNSRELRAAIDGAAGGEVFELERGEYEDLDLRDVSWETPVTLRSASGERARLRTVTLDDVHGLDLDRLDITSRVQIRASSRLEISRSSVGDGIYIRRGTHDVTISENVITGGRFGVWIHSAGDPLRNHHISVVRNDIGNQTGDNIQVGSCDNLVIEGNTIHDIVDNEDHNDGIQLMGGDDVTIRKNRISGQDQAMLLKAEPAALGAGTTLERIRVENNLVTDSRGAGIIVAGATDAAVVNNTGADNHFADIHVEAVNPRLEIWNNAVEQIFAVDPREPGHRHDNCVAVALQSPPDDTVAVVEGDVVDSTSYLLKTESGCLGVATADGSPVDDLDGGLRHQPITVGARQVTE